ncbi:Kinesin-like protein [Seminavis robusta]|uniref:Kinesin-like protein n=1 Tax=Seminavis robusta TaxID=568900 RepID=A0A9N8EUI7_9STRA|nr:Kinesin-like protein [Seminavis robusta]|eukprot:Sro1800_g298450.1 Kinesin-like protein (405) ;mRNA; r:12205-13419
MVQVIVRPHPDSQHLLLDKDSLDKKHAVVSILHSKPRSYEVTQALTPQSSQSQVFTNALEPLLNQWLTKGDHGALFAYGFTGTGKSYSLFGIPENPGGIWLSAQYLLENLPTGSKLRCSMCEIDGKSVKDLLVLDETINGQLTVRVDEQGSVHLRKADGSGPLRRVVLETAQEFQVLWEQAQKSRRVGSSTVHDASSRTHAVVDFEIVNDRIVELEEAVEEKHAAYIAISNQKDDALKERIEEAYKRDGPNAMVDGRPLAELLQEHGKPHEESLLALDEARRMLGEYKETAGIAAFLGSFSMIDMAGNDWEQATTMQTAQAKKEHSDINASLLAVKECFRAMQQGKRHIPFRRSCLTQILKRYFSSANSNCVMLTTIYPQEEEVTLKQTMNTLLYASSIAKMRT